MKFAGDLTYDGIINDFTEKYQSKNINQEQKEHIRKFIINFDSKKLNEFLFLLQRLMVFVLKHSEFKEETDLKIVVDKMSEKNEEKAKLDSIQSFIKCNIQEEENDEDDLDQMNQIFEENTNNENIKYSVCNLYPIYQEIGKICK